ncbi:MAG: lipoyl(octanoyl) transferase LipB [Desulfonatronovibrionaceae bacterium]
MDIIDLGLIPYTEAVDIQLRRLEEVRCGGKETVFFLRHPAVITLGRNGGRENLLISENELKEQGIEIIPTTRGGDITCHFPDQLVMYPVLGVEKRPGGIKKLIFDLQEAVINTLHFFCIPAEARPGYPGVWTNKKKIASIGIAVRHWVSYHGLSLNVGPDLSLFRYITPCGLKDAAQTSVCRERNDQRVGYEEIKEVLSANMLRQFAHTTLASHQTAQGQGFHRDRKTAPGPGASDRMPGCQMPEHL